CVGVRYRIDGQQHEARAFREVVVSAGSINSPQLLELSGVGQPERLRSVGIEVRHELKGVGENLRDHYSPRMKWTVPASLGMTYNAKVRGLGMVWQALRYALTHKGLLGLPAAPIRAYIRTRAGLDAPDPDIQSDDELLDWVRNNAETTYHPVGTCKMGSDPMAVVDDQLRVRGMERLRVADASIMPTLTSGNTNAPSIMIGEKAYRMILAAAA